MRFTWIAIIASSLTGIGALFTSTCESPLTQALLRAPGLGCVVIAGTGRVGARERKGAAIGVIYAIIPAIFAFRKFHEDWGGGGVSPMEAR